MTPYSPLKIFHHQNWISAIKKGEQPPPIFVQIIPTNRCNQNCSFCAYRMDGYSSNEIFEIKDELSPQKLCEIVVDCARMGVKAIELTGGGEPTIHPYFKSLIELILTSGINLGLVTNGAAWKPDYFPTLQHATWVRFSLDAAKDTTYSSMRKASLPVHNKVRETIRQLATMPNGKVYIGVGFVVTAENWREIEQAADFAYEDGASNFRISAIFQNGGAEYFHDFYEEAKQACQRVVEKYAGTPFKIFNLFGDRVSDLTQGAPDYHFCGFQQAQTYIGADYSVYRCCNLAYNHRGLLGSVKDQSFRQLWESEEKKKLITEFDAHGCERCMFNNKNRTILYAIEDNPAHVNFI